MALLRSHFLSPYPRHTLRRQRVPVVIAGSWTGMKRHAACSFPNSSSSNFTRSDLRMSTFPVRSHDALKCWAEKLVRSGYRGPSNAFGALVGARSRSSSSIDLDGSCLFCLLYPHLYPYPHSHTYSGHVMYEHLLHCPLYPSASNTIPLPSLL